MPRRPPSSTWNASPSAGPTRPGSSISATTRTAQRGATVSACGATPATPCSGTSPISRSSSASCNASKRRRCRRPAPIGSRTIPTSSARPSWCYAESADRGVLPASFTDTLATLHTLDWRAAGLEFLGVPEGGTSFALAEVAKWRELIAVSDRPPEPILTDLIAWLEENAPDHRPRLPDPRRLPHGQPAHSTTTASAPCSTGNSRCSATRCTTSRTC